MRFAAFKKAFWVVAFLLPMVILSCTEPKQTDESSESPPATVYKHYLYAVNSFTDKLSAYSINATTGALTEVTGSPYAVAGWVGGLAIHPSGKFLYVSNSQSSLNGLYGYSISKTTGALTALTGSPFNNTNCTIGALTADPQGRFLFAGCTGGATNDVLVYTIDSTTGELTYVGDYGTCNLVQQMAIDSTGKFLYTANSGSDDVCAFTINQTTGALSTVLGSPYPTGANANPMGIIIKNNDLYVAATANPATVYHYTFDTTTGVLSSGTDLNTGRTGSWSVMFAGNNFFVTDYVSAPSHIDIYSYTAATGAFTYRSSVTDGDGLWRMATAVDDQFLYMSNAHSDNIKVFSVNASTGALSEITGSPFAAHDWPSFLETIAIAQ